MYNQQIFKARIKYLCDLKNTTLGNMLSDLGFNKNLLTQATGNKGISSVALYMIAEYLGVSIDYLTGRTDKPEVNK